MMRMWGEFCSDDGTNFCSDDGMEMEMEIGMTGVCHNKQGQKIILNIRKAFESKLRSPLETSGSTLDPDHISDV